MGIRYCSLIWLVQPTTDQNYPSIFGLIRISCGFGVPSWSPLRDRIHGVDMVHTLGSLPVALRHGVYAQKTGPASGLRLAPLGDGDRPRPCRPEHRRLPPVA